MCQELLTSPQPLLCLGTELLSCAGTFLEFSEAERIDSLAWVALLEK